MKFRKQFIPLFTAPIIMLGTVTSFKFYDDLCKREYIRTLSESIAPFVINQQQTPTKLDNAYIKNGISKIEVLNGSTGNIPEGLSQLDSKATYTVATKSPDGESLYVKIYFDSKNVSEAVSNTLITTKASILGLMVFLLLSSGILIYIYSIKPLIRQNQQDEKRNLSLTKLNSELDLRIHELESDLDSKYVKKSLLTHYLVNVCHEIKTPLNVISAEINKANIENNLTISATKQLNFLIEDLASASRIANGNFEYKLHEFDWPKTLAEAISISKSSVSFVRKGNNFTQFLNLNSAVEVKNVVSDPKRITQMLSNLINNAIKYSKSSIIGVYSDLVTDGDEHYIECTVFDYGLGIKRSLQNKIFNQFTQDKTEQVLDPGHGLGLSLFKTFTEGLGGVVYIHSNNPTGLRVGFRIPVQLISSSKNISRIENERTGQSVAVVTSSTEFALLIYSTLNRMKVIHFNSLDELLKSNLKPEFVILGADSVDDVHECDELELIHASTQSQFLSPIERKKENFENWRNYTLDDLDTLIKHEARGITKSTRVLVVEDQEHNFTYYRNFLSNWDCSIVFCHDYNQGKTALNYCKFDIVLIDIKLDEIENAEFGYDLSLHAEDTINNDTPFLAMTNTAFEELKEFYLRVNINAVITKAISVNELERDIFQTLLEDSNLIFGQKASFNGIKTDLISRNVDLLKSSFTNDEIADCIAALNDLVDTVFTQEAMISAKRYKSRNDFSNLLPKLKLAVIKYFD